MKLRLRKVGDRLSNLSARPSPYIFSRTFGYLVIASADALVTFWRLRVGEDDRWQFILSLDEELLKGGATMSEWSVFIARECDLVFVAGANLATIIVAAAATETYLRAEYGTSSRSSFFKLIDQAPIAPDLKDDLHKLRTYRNQWVHISNPEDDRSIHDKPEIYEAELLDWGKTCTANIAPHAIREPMDLE